MHFSQGVRIEFRHHKAPVSAKAAAVHPGGLDDLLGTGFEYLAQLAVRGSAAHTAVDVKGHGFCLARQLQTWQQGVVRELVEVV